MICMICAASQCICCDATSQCAGCVVESLHGPTNNNNNNNNNNDNNNNNNDDDDDNHNDDDNNHNKNNRNLHVPMRVMMHAGIGST